MRPEAAGPRRMPSVEMEREPKALSLDELKYAREAALYVLRTHSSEDAVRIFTEACVLQGLKPVLGVRKTSMADSDSEDDDDLFNPDEFPDDDSFCHKYGRTDDQERDVATAPF